MNRTFVLLAAVTFGLGCSGSVGGNDEAAGPSPLGPSTPGRPSPGGAAGSGGTMTPPPGPAVMAGPSSCAVPPGPMRRLTRSEYVNSLRTLLGSTTVADDPVPADDTHGGYDNNVARQAVSPLLAEGYMKTAENVAQAVPLVPLVPCDPKAGNDDCARTFVQNFGKRAWRRPLRTDEVTRVMAVYTGHKALGFEGAVRMTLQFLLSSPQFIYRIETGATTTVKQQPLTQHELASRLSYLLIGSMPDDELFAAADAGKLNGREAVARQAERLLADPRARTRLREFFRQWLVLDDVGDVARDGKIYPGWTDKLVPALRATTEAFVEKQVFDERGTLQTLLTATHTYANKPLATYLGLSGVTATAGLEKVTLDPAKHAGLLTDPGILAMNSNPDQPSPIYRGRWVRQQLLCQTLASPPPSVDAQPPPLDPKATSRQKFAQHSSDPACSACHQLIDPLGFGFEHFDATGKWRANDRGLTIDASGEVFNGGDASGKFVGAVELGKKFAVSRAVSDCVTLQFFRWATGRMETDADACVLGQIRDAFAKSGGNLREMILAVIQSDGFLYRQASK